MNPLPFSIFFVIKVQRGMNRRILRLENGFLPFKPKTDEDHCWSFHIEFHAIDWLPFMVTRMRGDWDERYLSINATPMIIKGIYYRYWWGDSISLPYMDDDSRASYRLGCGIEGGYSIFFPRFPPAS
ncbi:hypothetical protein IC801_06680 [Geobacillus sp. 44B]|nr:hypothetical protein IC801_06680 [Geobacillus sp. 44B]